MRDRVIFINDRLVSLTHNSLLLIQPPTSPQSNSPIYVRVLVWVLGSVGTVEKVFFISRLLGSEHLIVLVHDIFDREKKNAFPWHSRFSLTLLNRWPKVSGKSRWSKAATCTGWEEWCLGSHQQMRGKQLKCRWVLSPDVTGGRFRTSITGTEGDTSWKYLFIIRSPGFCATLSIHTHLLELHSLRGTSSPLVQSMKPAHCTFKERYCLMKQINENSESMRLHYQRELHELKELSLKTRLTSKKSFRLTNWRVLFVKLVETIWWV